MSLFQSNLRKQIRNLPKILNFVKIIQYYSKLFTSLLKSQLRRTDAKRKEGKVSAAARAAAEGKGFARQRPLAELRAGGKSNVGASFPLFLSPCSHDLILLSESDRIGSVSFAAFRSTCRL